MLISFKRTIPNKRELATFYQQLATLLSAGIPLLNSIQMMQNMQVSLPLKQFLSHVHQHLLSGQPFSNSLQKDSSYAFARQLIYIGEQIGRLDHSLRMIAEFYETELNYKHQIKQALLYPCILCCTAFFMTLCLLLFIIPHFAILFEDHRSQLPLLTRFIFFIANVIQEHYLLALLPFLYLIFILLPLPISEQYRLSLQQTLLDIPILASLHKKINLARFSSQLTLLYQAGIPLTDAIQLMAAMTTSREHSLAIQNVHSNLLNGKNLYQATRDVDYFPTPLPDMIQVGELSGNLETMLKHITVLYEKEIERRLKQISQLLEPLIMIILGVLIGGLVIGMYLPIFKLGNII